MSNISNTKTPLSIAKRADELGFHVLLDAAALAPSTRISLRDNPVHAMTVSFYKMFGYPTGVGALIVKKDFLRVLRRPWFAGGTVDVVQVPGTLVTMAPAPEEQFEVSIFELVHLISATYRRSLVSFPLGWYYELPDAICDHAGAGVLREIPPIASISFDPLDRSHDKSSSSFTPRGYGSSCS